MEEGLITCTKIFLAKDHEDIQLFTVGKKDVTIEYKGECTIVRWKRKPTVFNPNKLIF